MVGISRSKIRSKLILFFVFSIALVFGVFLGTAISYVSAQTPLSTDGVIYACVNDRGGSLQIIQANKKCRRGETLVKFSTPGTQSSNTTQFVCPGCKFNEYGESPDFFQGKNLNNSYLPGARIIASNLSGMNFSNSMLYYAVINYSDLSGANFVGAKAMGTDLTDSNLTNAKLDNIDFTDANLQGAKGMDKASRKGIKWSNTVCPDMTNSNYNGNTCEGHLTP